VKRIGTQDSDADAAGEPGAPQAGRYERPGTLKPLLDRRHLLNRDMEFYNDMHDDMAHVESLLAKGRVDEPDSANEQNIFMGPEVDSPGGGPHREPVPVDITVPAIEGDNPGWKPNLAALSLADQKQNNRTEDRRRSNIEV